MLLLHPRKHGHWRVCVTSYVRLYCLLYVVMIGKKQMLYTTFNNLINILEEIERRQLQEAGKVPIPRSSTEWFDHSRKTIDTVRNNIINI